MLILWGQKYKNNGKYGISVRLWWLGPTPSDTHGLLVALCSGFSPDGVQRPHVMSGIKPGLSISKASTLPTELSL